MLDRQERPTRAQKTTVMCKTCDLSDSFYSSISVKQFKLEHLDHEIIEGNSDQFYSRREAETANGTQTLENTERARLLKVMVELVTLPAFPSPVFTITGVKEDLRTAFIQLISSDQREEVRDALRKCSYLDPGMAGAPYSWEPNAITFSEDALRALDASPPVSVGQDPSEGQPAAQDLRPSEGSSVTVGVPMVSEQALAGEDSAPTDELVAPSPFAPALQFAPADSFGGAASNDLLDSSPESESPPEHPAEAAEVSLPAEPEQREAGIDEGLRDIEATDDGHRLVSVALDAQAGHEDKNEEVRISKVLRPFNWKAEPTYSVGVISDETLSIETVNGEISGAVTELIEGAGYRLSGVTVDGGRPVAWFRREPGFETTSLLDVEEVSELKTKVSELERSFEEERKKARKDKEFLESRLLFLLRLFSEESPELQESISQDPPAAVLDMPR